MTQTWLVKVDTMKQIKATLNEQIIGFMESIGGFAFDYLKRTLRTCRFFFRGNTLIVNM